MALLSSLRFFLFQVSLKSLTFNLFSLILFMTTSLRMTATTAINGYHIFQHEYLLLVLTWYSDREVITGK